MKKMISLVLALCLACMLIPAVAEEAVTGEWYGSFMGMTCSLVLNEDGTFALDMAGNATSGKWVDENGTLTFTGDDFTGTAAVADGVLTMTDGVMGMSITFGREKPEAAYTPAEPKVDATLEDYAGKWGVAYIGMAGTLLDVNAFASMMTSALGADSVNVDVTAQMSADIEGTSIIIGRGTDSEQTLEGTFADGKLTVAAPEGTEAAGATLEIVLLEDSVLHMSTTVGEQTQDVYLVKVEAAEEPAA